jgi:hypothetical protein
VTYPCPRSNCGGKGPFSRARVNSTRARRARNGSSSYTDKLVLKVREVGKAPAYLARSKGLEPLTF